MKMIAKCHSQPKEIDIYLFINTQTNILIIGYMEAPEI